MCLQWVCRLPFGRSLFAKPPTMPVYIGLCADLACNGKGGRKAFLPIAGGQGSPETAWKGSEYSLSHVADAPPYQEVLPVVQMRLEGGVAVVWGRVEAVLGPGPPHAVVHVRRLELGPGALVPCPNACTGAVLQICLLHVTGVPETPSRACAAHICSNDYEVPSDLEISNFIEHLEGQAGVIRHQQSRGQAVWC